MRPLRLLTLIAALALLALPAVASASSKPRDRDHDGMPDRWEQRYKLSPTRANAAGDADHDGLSNRGEFRAGTSPRRADSDHDGLGDAREDSDDDGVENATEVHSHTNPGDSDSDDDGVDDGAEDPDRDGVSSAQESTAGTNPADADSDDDGVGDGAEVSGTVVSFDGTTLVVRRADATEITGTVSATTRITCKSTEDGDHGRAHASSGDAACSIADLIAGAAVHEAEVDGGAFSSVELMSAPVAPPVVAAPALSD